VYALDFPGHGFAAKRRDYTYGTPAYGEFVADFIKQLDVPSVHFAATSVGGHVAAWVACQDVSLVRSAILIGAVGLVPPSDEVVDASKVSDTSLDGIRRKLQFLVYDSSLVTDDWVLEESRINSSPGATGALRDLRSYIDNQLQNDVVGPQYAKTGIPSLLVWGADDLWVPPSVGHAAHAIMKPTPLVLMEKAGHAPYFERPDAFNKIALQFLADAKSFGSGVTQA
jgi:pimeloyl-ACP methyl ester carboxylesterase